MAGVPELYALLITNVVLKKLDVRETAADLPGEADEPARLVKSEVHVEEEIDTEKEAYE